MNPVNESDLQLELLAVSRYCCAACELKRQMRLAAALDARYGQRWEI